MRDTLSNMVSCFLMSRQQAHIKTSNSVFVYLTMLKVLYCLLRYSIKSGCTTLKRQVGIITYILKIHYFPIHEMVILPV